MADAHPHTDEPSSTSVSSVPPRRRRRVAGSAAGAPQVSSPAPDQDSSPRTTAAAPAASSVVTDAAPVNFRQRRRAAAASAPANSAAPADGPATRTRAASPAKAEKSSTSARTSAKDTKGASTDAPKEAPKDAAEVLAAEPKRAGSRRAERAERAEEDRRTARSRRRSRRSSEADDSTPSADSDQNDPSSQSDQQEEPSPRRRSRRSESADGSERSSRRRSRRSSSDDRTEDAPAEAADAPRDQNDRDQGERNQGVADDLQALRESAPEPKRQRRAAADTADFANLLFQAPTPSDQDQDDEPQFDANGVEISSALSFDAPDLEAARAEAERRREESRRRRAEQAQRSRDEADEDDDDVNDGDSDDSDDDDSEGSRSSSRRRRRRGGRGRRGRGRGDDDQRSSGDDQSSDDDDSDDDDSSEEEQPSSSRRRRRRRRSSGSSGEPESDDPPNTVVRVREARDEVRAVKGSTRLEAKRQRRREGRESGRRRHSITEAEFLARRESVKRSMIVRERPGRTQIAVLEDNILVEHYVAQKSQTSMVGNVYIGKVQNVLPSMEAAFIDIGKGRNAVLYAGEVNWDAAGLDGQPRRIELALKPGDPVLVQVTKDPIGHKGARLTSQISLPGRYLVFVPGGSMTGISRKLPENERARLKKLLKTIVPKDAGVIVRTAAEGATDEELTRDVERLQKQWEKIEKTRKSKNAPAALSTEPDLAIRVVRDIFNEDFTSLIVEGESVYQEVHEYLSNVAPDLLDRVTKHVGDRDSFAKHRVDEQLMKAMDRKVYLPSGGSLVIDRTEAMTVVDVNTGKFTGGAGGSLEETVTENNLEAAEEIVRQLRLRDTGGIIVIDFIDMVLESNRDLVMRRLIECLSRDRTKHQVAEVTSLGLVQMTRKRVGAGLVETFSSTCDSCNGRGVIIDLDGHQHQEAPAFEDDSNRRGRRGRGKRGGRDSGGSANGNGGRGSKQSAPTEADAEQALADADAKREAAAERARDAVQEIVDQKNSSDVQVLEQDQKSRDLARATIASIAAATAKDDHHHPEVTVDGQVISLDQEGEPEQAPSAQDEQQSAPAQDGQDAPQEPSGQAESQEPSAQDDPQGALDLTAEED
ncbi:Rne/Rng family ribonuclease [Helcobacillus massiliensis]|uniref:Rne/Rng family ribonuclease n=1 Tax=Helcobacillus massiliensis TaxID=521392 RepID=UPI0021A93E51|nr:Rne/Rng family ribonuclease [Helcobacillus massiliensis]MCT1557279.1 Rne/Rng family ribonuclease [Helcobacillus massiliensis]MCT2036242.1 Rne/Rng family ribonuclease [Helcobacillus massiliensis]MCT2331564.1 Rne/Rng family ribonuclease [Helcobacillus massiliensis]